MEMEFGLAPGALPKTLKPGDRVKFDMKAGQPGEYIVTRIEPVAGVKPAAATAAPAAPAGAHKH
jgi:Cu(I)/Ag(I) efflux system membrane fusion protein